MGGSLSHSSLPPVLQSGRTPLDCAATLKCITALFDGGATLGSPRPGTSTPLHVAAGHGSEALVRRLLAAGAPVNATDAVRWLRKPLHFISALCNALTSNPQSCSPLLLQDGRTPLQCAESVDCVSALLEGGADCKSHRPDFRPPLHVAAIYGNKALVRRLLEMGAPVNATDSVRQFLGGTD